MAKKLLTVEEIQRDACINLKLDAVINKMLIDYFDPATGKAKFSFHNLVSEYSAIRDIAYDTASSQLETMLNAITAFIESEGYGVNIEPYASGGGSWICITVVTE